MEGMILIVRILGWCVIGLIGTLIIVFTINDIWRTKKSERTIWPLIVGGFLLTMLGLAGIKYHFFMRSFIEEHDGIEADANTIKKLLGLKKMIDTCQAERALYKTVFEQCRASKVIPKDRIAQMCGMINEDPKIKKILYLPNFKGSNLSNAQFDEGVCREGSIGPYCEIGE